MGISKPSQGCVKHQKDMAVLYFMLYFMVLYFNFAPAKFVTAFAEPDCCRLL